MKRIGYVRTSTNKQHTDRQINELKELCDKIYVEDGVSARKKDRPVFIKVMKMLDTGDELIAIAYDRAFRNVTEGLTALDALTERGSLFPFRSVSIPPRPTGACFIRSSWLWRNGKSQTWPCARFTASKPPCCAARNWADPERSVMDKARIEHYRMYMKIYGYMMMELADDDEEILRLIIGDDLGPLLFALRERIEDSPRYD